MSIFSSARDAFKGEIYKTIDKKHNSHNIFVAMARSTIVLQLKISDLIGTDKDLTELMKLAFAHYFAATVIERIEAGGPGYLDLPLHELQWAFIDGLDELTRLDGNPLKEFNHERLTAGLLAGTPYDAFEAGLLDKIRTENKHLTRKMESLFKDLEKIESKIKEDFYKAFAETLKKYAAHLRTGFTSEAKKVDQIEQRIANTPAFAGVVAYYFSSIFFQESYLAKLKDIYIFRNNQVVPYTP
jgi:hypothetical protein